VFAGTAAQKLHIELKTMVKIVCSITRGFSILAYPKFVEEIPFPTNK